jgi:hypothetical protein
MGTPQQERSAGHRADFERERDRADRTVTSETARAIARNIAPCAGCSCARGPHARLPHPAWRELRREDARGGEQLTRPHPFHARLPAVPFHAQGVHQLRGSAPAEPGAVVPRPSKKATVFEIQSTVACNWTDPRFQIRLSGIGPTADVKWSRSITVYGCPAPDHQPRSSSPQAGGAEWLKDARGSPEVVGARTASPRMGLAIRYGQVAVRASAQGQSSCEL